jgi:hypothetical protein
MLCLLTLSWPAGHICPTYNESFQVRWVNSIPLFLHAALKYLHSVYKWYCVQCYYATLHTVSFVHRCFAGKCILTGSTEQRYFKVDGSMEKNRDTVIPADLKFLFISGTYSGFGGLEGACWPLVPKFSSSHPAETVGFLGRKNPHHAFLRRRSKAIGPMS